MPGSYLDLESYMKIFENISFLNCSNIMIFIFVFVNNLTIFSTEFSLIQRNLSKVYLKYYFLKIYSIINTLKYLICSIFLEFIFSTFLSWLYFWCLPHLLDYIYLDTI